MSVTSSELTSRVSFKHTREGSFLSNCGEGWETVHSQVGRGWPAHAARESEGEQSKSKV